MGQAEAARGPKQKVGVYDEGEEAAEGGAVYVGGESGFVGVARTDAAAAARGAGKGDACETGSLSRCQAP